MYGVQRTPAGIGAPLALLYLALAACASAPAAERVPPSPAPDFSGAWILNEESSDRPAEQVSSSGIADPRGIVGGRWGGGMSRSVQQVLAQIRQAIYSLERSRTRLSVQQAGSQIVLTHGDESRLEIRTDGQPVRSELAPLGDCQLKAGWKGDRLIVERAFHDDITIQDEYRRDPGSGRLVVTTKVSGPMPRAITFRSVYDPSK
jgi:hypothetical protein